VAVYAVYVRWSVFILTFNTISAI